MVELFFLFVTMFFVFKLKNTFGTRNNDEENRKKSIEEFFKDKYSSNMSKNSSKDQIINTTAKVVKKDKQEKIDEVELNLDFEVSSDIKYKLSKIKFDQKKFLNGVETAVEMINDAFSNKDLNTLENMLSKLMFLNFQKQLDKLNKEEKVLKSSLISVLSKTITSINTLNNNIIIDVMLKTEQINFIEDKDKNIISGNKKKIELVQEKWSFIRDLKSDKNFWIIDNIDNI